MYNGCEIIPGGRGGFGAGVEYVWKGENWKVAHTSNVWGWDLSVPATHAARNLSKKLIK